MHIDTVPNRKSPPSYLLRESYREGGKVKKRTLANLSALDPEQIDAIKQVLKGKRFTDRDQAFKESFNILSSSSHGHVAAVLGTMKNLKMPYLLSKSDSPERRNALALIAGRIICPSSKLALSRSLNGKATTLANELGLSSTLTEEDLYKAMRWLYKRQERIQKSLAKRHLAQRTLILYDLSSSYYEGSHCELAEFGYNRDKKKEKRQINYGLLTYQDGRPIAVEAFPGNTSDTSTVPAQLKRVQERFGMKRAIIVGDRGMLTTSQLELAAQDEHLNDFGWISALNSRQIKKLLDSQALQLELFDQRDLAEITSDSFKRERLVACRNPELAKKRSHDRRSLLEKTEEALEVIQRATTRSRNPYHGKDKIARRVEREAGKYKVLKHFTLTITETGLTFKQDKQRIKNEEELDGIYIIRCRNVDVEEMAAQELVKTYKQLNKVESTFRRLKTTSLLIRPIFHRESDMVRAHIFVCMLAYYVQWQMEHDLAELLFREEAAEEHLASRENIMRPAERSEIAKQKEQTKLTSDGKYPVHSFQSILSELGNVARIECQANIKGASSFYKTTKLTEYQKKAFSLLGLKIESM